MKSNFPAGFMDGVTIRGVPILQTHAGQIFFVNNSSIKPYNAVDGSDSNSGDFNHPLATWDAANNKCVASRGDVIILMPGHAETYATASAVTLDTIGVTTIGLGTGALRPTFTFSDTAATVVISAASVTVEGIIVKPSVDSVVSPIVVSGADCYLDIEHRDASAAVEAVRSILTTAGADRLNVKLKYEGFIAGNACVNAVRLVGVDTATIDVDFYGVASTSVVEFETTSCKNIQVSGYMYNSGTTDGSKLVVDTVGSSTWYADIQDGAAGARFSGGSGAALASDDVTAINTTLGTVNSTTTDSINGKIGTDTELADRSLFDLIAGDGPTSYPAAAAPANDVSALKVLRDVWDSLRNGTGGSEPATNKSIIDALGFNGTAFVAGGLAKYLPQCVAKTDGAFLTGADNIFTVVGTVRCKLVGLVTTAVGGATSCKVTMTTTVPAATVDLSAAAVACDTDAAGTIYYHVGATAVFTPTTSLGYVVLDPVTVEEAEFILTDGTIKFDSTAAQSGVVAWYCTYTPLTPGASVTAAA